MATRSSIKKPGAKKGYGPKELAWARRAELRHAIHQSGRMKPSRPPAISIKGMDTDISLNPVINTTTTNGSAFVLNLIQQGNGSWNRVGRKAHLKSLRIKGSVGFQLNPNFTTGVSNQAYLRAVLLWDNQPSGASLPTFDNIFGITAQDGTESCPDITCPLKYDVMDRYRVIRDWCIESEPLPNVSFGTGPGATYAIHIDEFVKLPDLETVFSGQSAPMTIADINTGGLYLFLRALGGTTTGVVSMDGIARLRYTD